MFNRLTENKPYRGSGINRLYGDRKYVLSTSKLCQLLAIISENHFLRTFKDIISLHFLYEVLKL